MRESNHLCACVCPPSHELGAQRQLGWAPAAPCDPTNEAAVENGQWGKCQDPFKDLSMNIKQNYLHIFKKKDIEQRIFIPI